MYALNHYRYWCQTRWFDLGNFAVSRDNEYEGESDSDVFFTNNCLQHIIIHLKYNTVGLSLVEKHIPEMIHIVAMCNYLFK